MQDTQVLTALQSHHPLGLDFSPSFRHLSHLMQRTSSPSRLVSPCAAWWTERERKIIIKCQTLLLHSFLLYLLLLIPLPVSLSPSLSPFLFLSLFLSTSVTAYGSTKYNQLMHHLAKFPFKHTKPIFFGDTEYSSSNLKHTVWLVVRRLVQAVIEAWQRA